MGPLALIKAQTACGNGPAKTVMILFQQPPPVLFVLLLTSVGDK
jgi:hypothetical protein